MSKLKIITSSDPLLRKKSAEVDLKKIAGSAYKKFFTNMIEVMIKKDGIGLAAPQIGKNIRIVIINSKEGPIIMVNPKIIKKSFAKEWGEEGCLSVPDIFGQVKRHKKIACSYYNEKSAKIKIATEGLMARVIQHEIDHLDGILFIDKAKDLKEVKK